MNHPDDCLEVISQYEHAVEHYRYLTEVLVSQLMEMQVPPFDGFHEGTDPAVNDFIDYCSSYPCTDIPYIQLVQYLRLCLKESGVKNWQG